METFKAKNYIISVLFHTLFRNKNEDNLNYVNPQQKTTIQDFRAFIRFFLEQGFNFVSPNDLIKGLDAQKRHMLVTFDDGYYNNVHALPILKEFNIPAVFFISTNHVKNRKCFWWDVWYRERTKSGIPPSKIYQEMGMLQNKEYQEIEKHIIKSTNPKAFEPLSDIDRPFFPDEVKDFAQEKNVFIGNHTTDHAILPNYSTETIKSQILNAQNDIHALSGYKPLIIAYPDGQYNQNIIKISIETGLRIGLTTHPHKNKLPIQLNSSKIMEMGRFILWGNKSIRSQCKRFMSDFNIETIKYRFKKQLLDIV